MSRRSLVLVILGAAFAIFAASAYYYKGHERFNLAAAGKLATNLVRPHSPIVGPEHARVTIIEFFDPSCEACREFYPHVKKILADHPQDVQVVLRYAPFHEGSDEAVKLLEAARLQGKFEPVLDALFESQPQWAIHGAPNLGIAWDKAKEAGLDVARAKQDAADPKINDLLQIEVEDIKAVRINGTPTFFVNGKRLMDTDPNALDAMVRAELDAAGARVAAD